MRIVAGTLRGRRLVAPAGVATRPTSNRVREALFSALESRMTPGLGGARVLDAYAGSGALGLEALSRGAERAVFVEKDRAALEALRRNIRDLGVDSAARVLALDVRSLSRRAVPDGPFSLLLLDPPYRIDRSEVRGLIEALETGGAISDGALIVWEHATGSESDWPEWVTPLSDRRYGSTTVSIGEAGRTAAG